jgi:PPOX class probable F420-dependent enzyme
MFDLDSEFGKVVKRHLDKEYVVWFTTVDKDLTPQPRPVWFVWDGETVLIFSQPKASKVRHIKDHPNVALNFNTDETGDKYVIAITGTAAIDEDVPPAHQVPAYFRKYKSGIAGLNMTPEEFSGDYSVAIRVTPRKMRGWA